MSDKKATTSSKDGLSTSHLLIVVVLVVFAFVHTYLNDAWTFPVQEHDMHAYRYEHISPCTIERVHSLTMSEFKNIYAGKKPFILTNTVDQAEFQDKVRMDAMTEKYGDKPVLLASSNTYSHDKKKSTVREYFDKYMGGITLENAAVETWYMFGDDPWTDILIDYVVYPLIKPLFPSFAFGVGGNMSGVPFHIHGPGFSEVIVGVKRWFLFDITKEPVFDSTRSSFQWINEVYPTLTKEEDGLLECAIGPGDLLYFPTDWYHATLNVGPYTVFVSSFTDERNL